MSILYLDRNSVDDSYVDGAANLLGSVKNSSGDSDLTSRDRGDDADTKNGERVSQARSSRWKGRR